MVKKFVCHMLWFVLSIFINLELTGYSDNNWARNCDDWKSNVGFVFCLDRNNLLLHF